MVEEVQAASQTNCDLNATMMIVKQGMFDEQRRRRAQSLVLILEHRQPSKQPLRPFRAGEGHAEPL